MNKKTEKSWPKLRIHKPENNQRVTSLGQEKNKMENIGAFITPTEADGESSQSLILNPTKRRGTVRSQP